MNKNASFVCRFINACRGIKSAFMSESSIKTHTIIALFVLLMAYSLGMRGVWLALLVILITQVLSLELINTALEYLCDLVHPEYSEKIKKIKDMAAGAVLIVSCGALIAAVIFILH